MGTPFIMKGSPMQRNFGIGSPLKGKGDNLKRIMTEKKVAAKKTGTWYKPGAEPKTIAKGAFPKDFNVKGDSWKAKTPGYESTKAAKAAKAAILDPTDEEISAHNTAMIRKYGKTPAHGGGRSLQSIIAGQRRSAVHGVKNRARKAREEAEAMQAGSGNISMLGRLKRLGHAREAAKIAKGI